MRNFRNDHHCLKEVSNELRVICEMLDVYGAQRKAKALKAEVDGHLTKERY